MSHLGISLKLQQIVRETPVIQNGCFSYAFVRLLVDRLNVMMEANETENEVGGLSDTADAFAQYVGEQTRWDTRAVDKADLACLIAHAESFLEIFE